MFFFSFILLYISCDYNNKCSEKIDFNNIHIELKKNNALLREYKRFLIISCKDNVLDKVELQSDIGNGVKTYLYDTELNYIVIDCNSNWYTINKKNGKINYLGEFWMKPTPKKYLGTYVLFSNKKNVEFIIEKNINLKDVYKYGGG